MAKRRDEIERDLAALEPRLATLPAVIPTAHPSRETVEAGGLMGYGTDIADMYRGGQTPSKSGVLEWATAAPSQWGARRAARLAWRLLRVHVGQSPLLGRFR
jgi:hypothetical protein